MIAIAPTIAAASVILGIAKLSSLLSSVLSSSFSLLLSSFLFVYPDVSSTSELSESSLLFSFPLCCVLSCNVPSKAQLPSHCMLVKLFTSISEPLPEAILPLNVKPSYSSMLVISFPGSISTNLSVSFSFVPCLFSIMLLLCLFLTVLTFLLFCLALGLLIFFF